MDQVFLLSTLGEVDISILDTERERALAQSLHRKGLINADGITKQGLEFLDFVNGPENEDFKIVPKKQVDAFERWWLAFPGTDNIIVDKKIIIKGSRSLRVSKEECRKKFVRILMEREYTADILIAALEYEVNQKIKKSISERKNHLSYLKNSLSYLNQRSYEPFIEVCRIEEEKKTDEKSLKNTGVIGI